MVKSFLEILTKRTSRMFYKRIDPHSLTNADGEGISSIANKLDKHDVSCD